jgi:hypothetical protein
MFVVDVINMSVVSIVLSTDVYRLVKSAGTAATLFLLIVSQFRRFASETEALHRSPDLLSPS